MTSSAQGKPFKQIKLISDGDIWLVFGFAVFVNFYFNFADFVEFILVVVFVSVSYFSVFIDFL